MSVAPNTDRRQHRDVGGLAVQPGLYDGAVVNGTVKIPGSGKVKFPTLRFGFLGGLCGTSIFGWASAAPGFDGRRRRNQGVGPDVLGQQIGMPTQTVT